MSPGKGLDVADDVPDFAVFQLAAPGWHDGGATYCLASLLSNLEIIISPVLYVVGHVLGEVCGLYRQKLAGGAIAFACRPVAGKAKLLVELFAVLSVPSNLF